MASRGIPLIAPYDNDDVLTGQGTAAYEAIKDAGAPDAIFATCGGGGLLSGTYLAKELLAPKVEVWGGEPKLGNDAVLSLKAGKVVRLAEIPKTVADGAMTLSVAERTFEYLKKLNGILEVEEEAMLCWSQWLTHLLKTPVEPTSALAMDAAFQWLLRQRESKTVIVILSGGNIAPEMWLKIWERNRLSDIPTLERQALSA